MADMTAEHMARVIDYLRNDRKGAEISLEDVMRLAEAMTDTLRSYIHPIDVSVYAELGEMAGMIASMKKDIGDIKLADMRYDRIPAAGRELDAIVEATETATNAIMSAAEEIMGADPSDQDAFQALVNDKVVEIFEACSFQDITGQRISKVVQTLNHLDTRISQLVERLKLVPSDQPPAPDEETAEERRRRELILHGPQLKGEGVSQDDIDALLA